MLHVGCSDLTADMGIPGDFDSPKLFTAITKLNDIAEKAASQGRFLVIGIGGFQKRPDLIKKYAKALKHVRYFTAISDNVNHGRRSDGRRRRSESHRRRGVRFCLVSGATYSIPPLVPLADGREAGKMRQLLDRVKYYYGSVCPVVIDRPYRVSGKQVFHAHQ